MNNYETIIIVDPTLDEKSIKYGIEEMKELINKNGKVTNVEEYSAIYYWTKDESNASVGKICFCVMFNQYDILHNNIDKWEFLRRLCNM